MNISSFVDQIRDFDSLSPKEQIVVVIWYLHVFAKKETVAIADVRGAFTSLHMGAPQLSVYLLRMVSAGDLLEKSGNYKLHRNRRKLLDEKYIISPEQNQEVPSLLTELPSKLSNNIERTFLDEALNCYKVGAFRAAIIMTWNLAFDHLTSWIMDDPNRIIQFNTSIPLRYPQKKVIIRTKEDFEELKEFEVIEIAFHAKLFRKNVCEILREKLKKRNFAAHPSNITILKTQADDVVTDLVNNVVLRLI